MMKMNKLNGNNLYSDRKSSSNLSDYEIARVVTVNKESFRIEKNNHAVFAEMSGKMLFNADSPLDFPAVGDWVYAQFYDDGSFAVIQGIAPRKSILKRRTAGIKNEYQLIAANIDTAFIVQSFGSDFNIRRLERYLVMVNEGNIQPVVLLSKNDLFSENERQKATADIRKLMPEINIIEFSNINHSGIDKIKDMLAHEKSFCLLGSSGVGKTTLLNNLTDDFVFKTNAVREKNGKGRHTTTMRQLVRLKNGALIIDTPGMRELGNIDVSAGMDATFSEIAELSGQCLYKNCSHTNEKGCAVLNALKEGVISEERFRNYAKMNKEAAYNEMTYFERRRKDKKFAKLCKSVMKNKKNKG